MMDVRTILFVDGENLVFRYQDEVKAGRIPADDVIHEPDCFVWHPGITTVSQCGLFRVCYYTTVVGSDERVEEIKQKLSGIVFKATPPGGGYITGQVVPLV